MSNVELNALMASFSTYYYAVNNFKSPIDPDSSLKPYKNQMRITNIIDFGYDLSDCIIRPPKPPKIVVVVGPRQDFGKSENIAYTCAGLICRNKNFGVGVMNNTEENAKTLIRRIKYYIDTMENNAGFKVTKHTTEISLSNGSFCKAYGVTDGIRGNSFDLLIIDEAAQIPSDIIKQAAMPTVRKRGRFNREKKPDIILLSTPLTRHDVFGYYYTKGMNSRMLGCRKCLKIFKQNELNIPAQDMFTKPNGFKCPDCNEDDWEYVHGRIAVYQVNPFEHPEKTKEEVLEELELVGNTPSARAEILGLFPDDGEGVFSSEFLQAAVNFKRQNRIAPKKHYRYIIGGDFGKTTDNTTFCVGHLDMSINSQAPHSKSHILDYIQTIPSKGGVSYRDIRYELLKLVSIFEPYLLVLDSTGIGDAVVEDIYFDIAELRTNDLKITTVVNGTKVVKTILKNPNLKTVIYNNKAVFDKITGRLKRLGFVFDTNSKFELIENAKELFAREKIELPSKDGYEIDALIEELKNFSFQYSQNGRIIYGTQNGHDDRVIALCLMLWGMKTRPKAKTRTKVGDEDEFKI